MALQAQTSLEFLLVISLTISFIFIILSSLSNHQSESTKQLLTFKSVYEVQPLALMVGTYVNDGAKVNFPIQNISYRIEQSEIHVSYGERIIEVGGIFEDDSSEPI